MKNDEAYYIISIMKGKVAQSKIFIVSNAQKNWQNSFFFIELVYKRLVVFNVSK